MLLAALVASAGAMVHVGAPPRSAVARSRVLMQQEPESDRYNFADPRPLLKSFFLRDEPTPSFHTRHWAEGARGGGHGRGPHRVTPVSFKFFHHMCLLARMRVVQVLVRSRRVPPRAQSIPCGSPRKATETPRPCWLVLGYVATSCVAWCRRGHAAMPHARPQAARAVRLRPCS